MRLVAIVLLLPAIVFLVSAAPPDRTAEAARLNNLGVAYMNQQLFDKALKSFDAAAAAEPGMQVAQLNRGVALLNLQRVDDAKLALDAAIKADPKDPHAWYNLGLYYKNTSDTQAAADAFRRVTELDPSDADTWYMLGSVLAQAKQFPQAIDAFQHALKLNPLHASAEFGSSRSYQQSGDTAKAREHLARFQYITQNKLGSTMSLAYGEQGQYSRAEESSAVQEKVGAAIAVKFVDVTQQAGLAGKPLDPNAKDLAFYLGSGACFLDYDGDGKVDLLLADSGPQGGLALYHNLGSKFEDVTRKAGLDPAAHAIGCAIGDYDNDGFPDIALGFPDRVSLWHNEKTGVFKDVTASTGIKAGGVPLGLTFVDYDHDGDLDLHLSQYRVDSELFDPRLAANSPPATPVGLQNQTWRNNGNGSFTDVTPEVGAQVMGAGISAVSTDYNNDRAIDLVETAWRRPPLVFENPREGKFVERERWPAGVPAGSAGLAVLDFDKDSWMDVALTHWGPPGLSLWHNDHARSFAPVALPGINWVRGWGLAPIDYDNDGWMDLVAVGETAQGKGEVRLFRNLGPDGFKDVSAEVGLDQVTLNDPRAIIVGDYDDDGANDLLITRSHGPAILLRNQGGNKNNYLKLALKGLNDNKSAIGTKVEVFAGATRQKWEIQGASGYLGQNSPYLIAGLGQNQQVDVVRMLWPTGVLQDEIEIAANQTQPYLEIDRRGSSCPTLFVWDGERYRLVADMIGAGVVGHWVAPGERNVARPTEYIKLDRKTIHLKDGKISFRFMEPLEEAVYLDQAGLLAVDHPAPLDVFPNEYFASNPPFPPFKVVFSRDARPPAAARDQHGHDLLPALLAHKYVGDFQLLSFAGFTEPHTLELDLGEPYRGGPLWMLMHGAIEYFSATSMYAADQAGLKPIAPSLDALDAAGKWVRVLDDMGFPAGGPRTITVDLTGKLPRGAQRIRIATNLQIYWDDIRISRTSQQQPVKRTPVPLTRAALGFHGFPLKVEDQPPGNVKYIYENVSATGPYTRPAGSYTRYGDVRPLLAAFDDKLAVFGSGDEVALEFDPSSLPALPPGWVRDYFFMVHGYEKDMDFYAYDGNHVGQLPFRAMGSYPYAEEKYPLSDEQLKYLLEYNTRFLSGNEARGYAFDYAGGVQK